MATKTWDAHLSAKAKKVPYTVGGTIETDDIFRFTCNGKVLSVVAGSTVAATVAASIVTAFNASTEPEFEEVTASDAGSGVVHLTGDTLGKEFTFTPTTVETGGGGADAQTFTQGSDIQALEGPSVLKAGNFTGAALPGNGDTLIFQDSSTSLLYSLTALSGVTLALLDIHSSFTGDLGLAEYDKTNTTKPYKDYRPTHFTVGASAVRIGWGSGSGSGRIKLDLGTVATVIEVYATGTSSDSQYLPVQIRAIHATNILNVYGGRVDICPLEADLSTFATIRVSGAGEVRGGPGLTLTNLYVNGGKVTLNQKASNITNLEILGGGTVVLYGTSTITNLYVREGTLKHCGDNPITNLLIGSKGSLDLSSNSSDGFIVTNCEISAGGKLLDPFKRITFSNPMVIKGKLTDVTIDIGNPVSFIPVYVP